MSTIDPLNERQLHIVETAMRLFSRYGVRRTTMNDIALEAEVARQTLYNAFANKDEVLRAIVRVHADHTCAAIKAGIKDADGLTAELALVVHQLAVVPWDMLANSHHAEDIMEGLTGASRLEMDAAEARYRKLVQGVLKPYGAAIRARGSTPTALADFLVASAFGLKHQARDRVHLLRLLSNLTCAVASLAEPAAQR